MALVFALRPRRLARLLMPPKSRAEELQIGHYLPPFEALGAGGGRGRYLRKSLAMMAMMPLAARAMTTA